MSTQIVKINLNKPERRSRTHRNAQLAAKSIINDIIEEALLGQEQEGIPLDFVDNMFNHIYENYSVQESENMSEFEEEFDAELAENIQVDIYDKNFTQNEINIASSEWLIKEIDLRTLIDEKYPVKLYIEHKETTEHRQFVKEQNSDDESLFGIEQIEQNEEMSVRQINKLKKSILEGEKIVQE
jgi:hypothetical protein